MCRTSFNHRSAAFIIAAVLLAAGPAFAGSLKGYYTTDSDVKDTAPPNAGEDTDWTEMPDDGRITLSLEKGDEFWIAFDNSPNEHKSKYIKFRWEWEDGFIYRRSKYEGFDADGDAVRADRIEYKGKPAAGDPDPRWRELLIRFTPQPAWERFRFVASADFTDKWFEVCATSVCQDKEIDEVPAALAYTTQSTIGAEGAMLSTAPTRELWLFPRTTGVDPDAPAAFQAPPGTGPWSSEVVFVDPTGEARPLGGVRWFSDGPGLAVEEEFEATAPLLEYVDRRYDLFLIDAEAGLTDVVIAPPPWTEGFDDYPIGPLAGLGGWEPWDGEPAAGGFEVTGDPAQSAPHALEIDSFDDAVHQFFGLTYGRWEVRASIYVPSEMQDVQYLVLLNEYPAVELSDWSMQVEIDGAAGLIRDFDGGAAALPLVRDAWTTVRVLVDLERDEQTVFYGDDVLVTKSWTAGVGPGGALALSAVDLWGNGAAAPVFYDDLVLIEFAPEGGCVLEGVCVNDTDIDECIDAGGDYLGHGVTCAEACPSDLDGDWTTGVGDLLQLLASWGACPGCAQDLDGDGAVGVGDLLLLLAGWGTCGR